MIKNGSITIQDLVDQCGEEDANIEQPEIESQPIPTKSIIKIS